MHKPEPVVLVHAEVPMLVEAVVILMFLSMVALWAMIASGA